MLCINYYTAKTIMRTYREKGRICKKLTRKHRKAELSGRKSAFQKPAEKHEPEVAGNKDVLLCNVNPCFSFKPYREAIANEYNKNFEKQIQKLKYYVDRTLLTPDLVGKNNSRLGNCFQI
eukprot:TRINITY_DN2263_c0_g2_i3.p1 TRINITY_DN2263_c0_g2~~TRINITY_DN2263_c0_g2_i3.p1  ORF type:complete len:120 (+),score=7.79 TRINITY_DN2263_c0_g2_i3:452-811(+)